MDMQEAIAAVIARQDLAQAQMSAVMRGIMTGNATPAQIGGFLVGLRLKGETVDEIVAAAKVMRELATPVSAQGPYLVDTCGTGGDGASSFNVSTASAIVVAAAGGKVAKHGNRSVSSKSGSADVLEAAGVNLDLSPERVAQCIAEIGVGFLFAPKHGLLHARRTIKRQAPFCHEACHRPAQRIGGSYRIQFAGSVNESGGSSQSSHGGF